MSKSRRMELHRAPARPELDALLKRSVAAYDAMTPEQKREHDEAQRQSWVRGMAPCDHGVGDWETCQSCREEHVPSTPKKAPFTLRESHISAMKSNG